MIRADGSLSLLPRIALGILIAAITVYVLPDFLTLTFTLSYAAVGVLLAIRRPRNVVGWLLIAIAVLNVGTSTPGDIDVAALQAGTPTFRDALVVWIGAWSGGASFLLLALLTMVFPQGHLPTGGSRRVAVAGLVIGIAIVALMIVAPAAIDVYTPAYPNGVTVPVPFSLAPPSPEYLALQPFGFLLLLGVILLGVGLLLHRYRHADDETRLQIRWVLAAIVFVLVAILFGLGVTAATGGLGGVEWLPAVVSYPTVPISIAIAILRYRLYEIDTIINRTVLYGAVTLLVLAIFGVANLGVQQLAQYWLGGPSVLLAGFLGIVVGMLYVPIRRAVRPVVDRFLPSRSLVTMLFTDIVGSTEQIVALGDDRWRILLGRYRAAVRQELSSYSGQEVDTAGDAFFATFQRPAQGVRCAVAIRAASAQLGIQLRTGLHLGEVEMRGETLTGIEVHTAARVMAAAEPGEILLSAAVRQAIQNSQFATTDRGSRELKGVPGSWHLFGLDSEGTGGSHLVGR